MANENMYLSQFGVIRVYGRGEGRDELCDATAQPALGGTNVITVDVNENGPVENAITHFGRGAAKIPAGGTVVAGKLLVDEKGSADDVELNLVDKDGTNAVALLAATTPSGDNVAIACEGAAIGQRFGSDKYVKVSGTTTGLKAKLVLEFI